jgi:hypothetical protein
MPTGAICIQHRIKCVKLFVKQIGTAHNPMFILHDWEVNLKQTCDVADIQLKCWLENHMMQMTEKTEQKVC